jgi:hypothetical protein
MEKLTTKDETDQLPRLDLRMKEARTRFLFIIPQQLHSLAELGIDYRMKLRSESL